MTDEQQGRLDRALEADAMADLVCWSARQVQGYIQANRHLDALCIAAATATVLGELKGRTLGTPYRVPTGRPLSRMYPWNPQSELGQA